MRRRTFLSLSAAAVAAYGAHMTTTPAQAAVRARAAATTKPNVVFVLLDDLGYRDTTTGAFGGRGGITQTPVLDRMVAEGTAFANAYSAPSCSPTRQAIMTGLEATRPDNNAFQVGTLLRGWGTNQPSMLVPPEQGQNAAGDIFVKPSTPTLGDVAKAGGYRTSYVGKFHLAADRTSTTEVTAQHGFDIHYEGRQDGVANGYHAVNGRFDPNRNVLLNQYAENYTQAYVDTYVRPYAVEQPTGSVNALVGQPKHVTDAIADATALEVGVGPDPTFTFVGHYAPHEPVDFAQGRLDLRRKYDQRANADGHEGYSALVEQIDQTLGRLLTHLNTTPDPRSPGQMLAANTVVIVTSDNGGRTDFGADNTPLRGQKGEVREGGIRVPFVAWSGNPALVQRGATNTTIVKNPDVMSTLADYAQVSAPNLGDGISLADLFAVGGVRTERVNVVHMPGYWRGEGLDQRPETVLRYQRWKVAYKYESQRWSLRDLEADPGEMTELSSSRPAVFDENAMRLLYWLDRTKAPLPTLRQGEPTLRTSIAKGDKFYRYGRIVTADAAQQVITNPGGEIPVILKR